MEINLEQRLNKLLDAYSHLYDIDRDVRVEDMENVYADLQQIIDDNDAGETYRFMGIRE